MGIVLPQLLTGTVMHKRLLPKKHVFHYGIYYVALPLSQLSHMPLAYNRFAALSFYDKDHGPCDGSALDTWAGDILKQNNVEADGEITLMCMPRVLGYVFNPVSFWFCHNKQGQLMAVLCEVHNTFGEKHTYLCANKDRRPIMGNTTLFAEKLFHVSPFLTRDGHYQFKFEIHGNQLHGSEHHDAESEANQFNGVQCKVHIDFHNKAGEKQLITALVGNLQPLTKSSLNTVFWRYPFITFKAVLMIHWHAFKLLIKGIQYIAKPKQKHPNISTTD
jgi:uncharacterized protein